MVILRTIVASAAFCMSAGSSLQNIQNTERYPEAAGQWDRVSEILASHPLLRKELQRAQAELPHPPHVSLHRVHMSDGVGLDTILINPHPYDEKKAACLARSPYGPTSENLADVFVGTNGFAAILQDDRGTFLSGGEFDIWKTAASDGNDTVNWITSQDWSNGDVFTVGVSADGINEAMFILADSPALKGQWLMWTTANGHDFAFNGGAYREDILDGYMEFMNPEVHFKGPKIIHEAKTHEGYGKFWSPIAACPATGDDTHPLTPDCQWGNVKWPVVLTTGWWDVFHHSSINMWNALVQASDPSVRDKHIHIINPLGHCLIASVADPHPILALAEADGVAVSAKVAQEIFRGDFAGPTRSKLGRVNMFVMGGFNGPVVGNWNYWTSLADFPPFTATNFFLHEGKLLPTACDQEGSITYTYDPASPTPMLGGNNLPLPQSNVKGCGTEDQASREARDDVITFDSEALAENTPVVGNLRAKLFVSSSAKDTDFVVTVSDVHKGKSSLVRYGVQRMRWRDSASNQSEALVADRVYEVDVDLSYTAYVFPKGHSIRVSVASAAYPYYSANSNSGSLDLEGGVPQVAARNSVYFSPSQPSQVILPVVAYADIPKNKGFGAEGPETVVV